jgi:phosphotransferase system enzyme I (PtsI)
VENALRNDAEGIGLFRSEFIYLEAKDYPSEEEQFEHYKRVVEAMGEKQVIIRTLDIGADKKIDYFDLPEEENPALGFRSIRICKARPEIFAAQLQALYRASAYGNLAVMVPMIISESEIKWIHEMAKLARENLTARKLPFNKDMKIGIMVETPAAAIMSDVFAKSVDFFSIGTNDLSQYTLAIDRVNPNLASSFNPHHRAICRLIKLATESAHAAGIPIGICGELARDEKLLPFFLKIGVDELSVSPAYTLSLRAQIATIDTKDVDVDSFIN